MQRPALAGGHFGSFDDFTEAAGEPVAPADHADTNAVGGPRMGFREQVFVHQPHQGCHLGLGPLPVVRRKGVEG